MGAVFLLDDECLDSRGGAGPAYRLPEAVRSATLYGVKYPVFAVLSYGD